MGGYSYVANGETREMPPLWRSQLHFVDEERLELGFRDLIELRFVAAFIEKGLSLQTIRSCLEHARECVKDERPFSTRRFRTDGRTIFLDSLHRSGAEELLDLKTKQYAFKQVLERSFKDLDLEGEAVARWRPFQGKPSIVIDPLRSFGQPVASAYGVPTAALAVAVKAEGSIEQVARLYEMPPAVVRDAVEFENDLRRAA